MELSKAIQVLRAFQGKSLRRRIAAIEGHLQQREGNQLSRCLEELEVAPEVLGAALVVKSFASQVNVVIHALGVLAAIPRTLEHTEKIEFLSLGAGNTGRSFDLETDRRIAEFKFISWQGGPESIRQNSLFKDFFELAEADTSKRRYLYVIGLTYPLKFLTGSRALDSVLSRNNSLRDRFHSLYGDRFRTVSEYFRFRQDRVSIVDLSEIVPELSAMTLSSEQG